MATEHEIKQGETAAKIAEKYGMTEKKIWDAPANAELKNKCDDSNILSPGDIITIPDMETKEESIQTGSKHRFQKKIGKIKLKIQLKEDDEPRANIEYLFEVDGKLVKGTTDKDGYLEQEVPTKATKGIIYIGEDEEIPVNIGKLDPVTDISGVQERLSNLGYDCGSVDGKLNTSTKAAIRGFQEKNNLDVTGEPDKTTREKLVEIHGC